MRSSYKRLGPYIRELKIRNNDGDCSDLRGVSIGKEFMPSVANVHGTDLSKYKRVEKGQFAFNPMHVGRDEVLPIALFVEDEPVIVSPAYVVFEVRDRGRLLPEYLMMWCRRPEFDRNAWFTTDNSVRGGFSWSNFCDMELPIPSVEKQWEIVKEYQTVVDRIRLNERLNEKLEEAAQTIYKQWFVDFEFPMTAEYAESIDRPELTGQPYKSSGGKMEYNEALEQEIPKGWTNCGLSDKASFRNGKSRPAPGGTIPVYGGNGIMGLAAKHNAENVVTIGRVGIYCGAVHQALGKCWVSDNAICADSTAGRNAMLYFLLKALRLNERSEGTGQPLITQSMLNGLQIPTFEEEAEIQFEKLAKELCLAIAHVDAELAGLGELASILLSRLAQVEGAVAA